MNAAYSVDRVALLFTGGDVPHTHAHVIPMLEKIDVTGASCLLEPSELAFDSEHLRVTRQSLPRTQATFDLE